MLLSESMPPADQFPRPTLNEGELEQLGLRKLTGETIEIWTDLPSASDVDRLPNLFDRAVQEWSRYFEVSEDALGKLQLVGYVMKNESRFKEAGLIPTDLPPFHHGFQRGYELWIRDQPSDYYRRHLVLHEGVHAFMNIVLGGTGPAWYREGIAEHLATHRMDGAQLQVGVMPRSREEVPYWGRIKILQEQFAAGEAKMIDEVMRLSNEDFLETEGYAWAWAAVAYMDGHPAYRRAFRQLRQHVSDNPIVFARRLLDQVTARLRQFDEQWQLFIVNVDYGYDFAAEAVRYQHGLPLSSSGKKLKIAANRGWQSTGVHLSAGKVYRVAAAGQFQLQQRPEAWWSEPGGITLTYYRGMPLGLLIGSVRLDEAQPGVANLGTPIAIGLQRRIRPARDGTLYLRVNDFPGGCS